MDPNNNEFDDLDVMLSSLSDDDDDDNDKYSLSLFSSPSVVSSATLSGLPLPEEEDPKDTCSSSGNIKNEKEKAEGKNYDVGSSSLLGKRRDVRERESVCGPCKKVKGVCENFVGFPDCGEIDAKCSKSGQKGKENCGLKNYIDGGFNHDLGSGELPELLPSLEELLDPIGDRKVEFLVDEEEDCREMVSVEDLFPEIGGSAQLDDQIGCDELPQILNNSGEMDPAIDDEDVNNQNLVGDRRGEEIDTLVNLEGDWSEWLVAEIVINLEEGAEVTGSSYQCGSS
uniref:Uncharacterized protein n=1 Tax=Rhizophora mucronata TaxID=61149 RepID=A0A2P2JMG9_RHIMU